MRHRDFLLWLKPQLDRAVATGLAAVDVSAIRTLLEEMRRAGALQPFASKLLTIVRAHEALDATTVADLATEIRSELAPPRERTMLLSAIEEDDDK
jgi:hypothetical protein